MFSSGHLLISLCLSGLQETFQPTLTRGAQEVLMRYYELQRRTDTRSAARTTLRLLESLVRLAQAHARLCFRSQARVEDAIIAVMLVETSMHTSAMLNVTSVLHAGVPAVSYMQRLEKRSDGMWRGSPS